MFTTEFKAEIDESESATLNHYYREAMTQGYNFAFEVKDWKCGQMLCLNSCCCTLAILST